MDSKLSDAAWLERRADTLFALDSAGRMTAERDPSRPPPRVFIQRTATCLDVRIRRDVPDTLVGDILALTASEPAEPPPGQPFRCQAPLQALLDAKVTGGGPVYELPALAPHPFVGELIATGSELGDGLLAAWRRASLPAALSGLGFTDADDVWRPWCIIRVEGEVAAVCQTARLGDHGAEAGVVTVPAFRGRGLAAAVTAAWSRHPDLGDRTLYYSTTEANHASQRVAAGRLGLVHRAQDLRLD